MISVIVPIYKVEKYLVRCIESLLCQTYHDIEIILVDDGSPDECPSICDEYIKKDRRIKIIHQKNAGVSAARNAGLREARGEYIGFCDSDDFVHPQMYEELVRAIERDNTDLAICGYDYVDEDGVQSRKYVNISEGVITQKECFRLYFDMPPSIRLGVCNKLFRHNLLQDFSFREEIKGAEDADFLGKYIDRIRSASIVNRPLYLNCERVGSATRGGLKSDSVEPALEIYQNTRSSAVKKYPDISAHAQRYYLDACLLNSSIYRDRDLSRKIMDRVRKEFPSMVCNKEIHWKTRVMYILYAFGLWSGV